MLPLRHVTGEAGTILNSCTPLILACWATCTPGFLTALWVHWRLLSFCSSSRRQWSRQLTTSFSHKPWMHGETWLQVINSVQPPCCWTLWRRVLLCWRITFWRLTLSGRTQTIFVSGLCYTEGAETLYSRRGKRKKYLWWPIHYEWYFIALKVLFFYN